VRRRSGRTRQAHRCRQLEDLWLEICHDETRCIHLRLCLSVLSANRFRLALEMGPNPTSFYVDDCMVDKVRL
jgi:hypothetical protein